MPRWSIPRVVIVAGMMLSVLWGAGPVGAAAPAGAGSVAGDAPGVSVDVPASWWAGVQEEIRRSEYEVRRQEGSGLGATYQAPNRAHNLRTYFGPEGIRVVPRTEGAPSWAWGLRLAGYGREGAVGPVAAAELVVVGNRVAYERGELTEWYVNDERGLEQGFTLLAPPVGGESGWLALEMALTGELAPRPARDGAVEFVTVGGVRALRYGELWASDAAGRALPARLEVAGEGLRILVDDSGAEYPLTIDPLATSPSWSAEGDQAGALFGISVATAGDVNGDGYADVIVGAQGYDNADMTGGRAFVYHGSASGLGTTAAWSATAGPPPGDVSPGTAFGHCVGTAGDVNGDGFSDVIVGGPAYNSVRGRAYVYHGSATGLAASPAWTADGDTVLGNFGWSLGTAGDVNGDGYADVIVGAYGEADGRGRAHVYHGSPAGLSTLPAWTATGEENTFLGIAVGTAGDVNGDGFSDVIVGVPCYDAGADSPNTGRAYVYLGSASGLDTTPGWTADGEQADGFLGSAVGTAGDVNGDGYADVIVGEPMYDGAANDAGRVHVYHGSATGLSTGPSWTADGDETLDGFGCAVASAGDVNGDGYADVIVGACGDVWGLEPMHDGRASVYLGSGGGLSSVAAWALRADQAEELYGYALGTAGDVNGDGYADVIVGALSYDGDQVDEGRACVYYGSASGPAATAGWSMEGEQAGANFGWAVGTAGDVNGDGYADVLVGASTYDGGVVDGGRAFLYYGSPSGLGVSAGWTAEADVANSVFGHAVGTAGDVNGDGYADVVVGAPGYHTGTDDGGRAFVYYGSASGPSTTPDWVIQGTEIMANLGIAAATAGDVNGDGYADVIVGAMSANDFHGAAYVYHGSPDGLSGSPDWVATGDQRGAYFGNMAATAGDVNGDGYADVIVSAPGYDAGADSLEAGRAYLYLGSPAGVAGTPAWTAEGEQPGAVFGWPVGTAGDVNGDGYADVIVGEPTYDGATVDVGRVHVYLGSEGGLGSTAGWTAVGDQAEGWLGYAAATAGDVNGDGYADVVVGAFAYDTGTEGQDVGQACFYLGSAAGLGSNPSWTVTGDQPDALYGYALGTAGDVNGDGYAEIVVGAPGYNGGATDEGRALLYYGNGGPGLSLAPRQLRADGSGPIAHLGSAGDTAFRLALLGRSPFGRGKVKLQWEVKPLGTPFDGAGLGTSSEWMDSGTAGAALDELVAGLAVNTAYHWRVRLLYHPASTPFQQHSRWVTQPWNGWQEARLRSLASISADLSLGMTVTPDPAYAGAPLTYTVSVSNAGPSTAWSVSVMVDLPEGAGFLSATGSEWTCQEADGVVTCTRDSLAPGEGPPITVVVEAPDHDATLMASAQVSAATDDPHPENDSASVETVVVPLADLSLGMTVTPDPAYGGAPLTYTISVSNAGPSVARSVTMTVDLPEGAIFLSVTGAGWACQEAGGAVTCTRDSLAPGDAPAITIVFGAPVCGGYVTMTPSVTAATGDPNPDNNTVTLETPYQSLADVSLGMTDHPDPVYVGAPLTYTFVVRNNGPSATGVLRVACELPAGATFVSVSGDDWECTETDGFVRCERRGFLCSFSALSTDEEAGATTESTWPPPPLLPGEETAPVTIALIAPSEPGVIASTAQLTPETSDPNPANDTATVETTVIPYADLALYVADTPDPVYAGAPLTYTVHVVNAGLNTATSVEVAATLPLSTTFVSAAGEGWECTCGEGIVTCRRASVGAVPGTWTPLLRITILTPETRYLDLIEEKDEPSHALISAGFAVSAAEEDPEPGNNQVVVETTVRPGRHGGNQK